jgi:hypothetical protein
MTQHSVNKFKLLEEIRHLNQKEQQLAGQKAAIHHDQICFLFSLGQRIQQLYEACEYGEYKAMLTRISFSWADADRKRKVWLTFGKYRNEPWISNFGKSALQEMAYGKKPDLEIIEQAIALAKSGVKVGVSWVWAVRDKKRSCVPLDANAVRNSAIRKTRLSAKVRQLVHAVVDEIGEEELLKVLQSVREARRA